MPNGKVFFFNSLVLSLKVGGENAGRGGGTEDHLNRFHLFFKIFVKKLVQFLLDALV